MKCFRDKETMSKVRIRLSFSGSRIKRPFVYELGKKFNVVTNIRRAEVSDSEGWVVLELESEQKEIDRAIKWTIDEGVHVTIIEGDFIEG
jgi:ABC-type methionine transport system ATPase subunit|tara:strand:- start:760 stop:1029 length:270 start_codon:yes stop_codon:yes gene_type:complete